MWTTAERVAADGPSPVGHETRVEMFAIGEAVATVASEATSQAWTAYLWILEDLLSAAAGGDARLYEAAHAAAKVGEAAFISAARRDLTT
jgi:hypothetical protein